MDEQLEKYRAHLIQAEQKAQEDFDKTVLSLSGGALGISFIFIKDIIGDNPIACMGLLLAAWICWGLSVTSVLASFYTSHLALRRAVKQTDDNKIYSEQIGGFFDKITAFLNAIGGILFLAGVITMIIFVRFNLEV